MSEQKTPITDCITNSFNESFGQLIAKLKESLDKTDDKNMKAYILEIIKLGSSCQQEIEIYLICMKKHEETIKK